jgi:hypothetical protein
VEIQPKGLIATEAIFSIPLRGQKAGVLAVNSHFFEFIELSSGDTGEWGASDTKLAHELGVGKLYSVIVTTGGGLYRYHMQDCIEVIGHLKQCPVIVFVGKSDKVVDICGEKLNERFAAGVLEEAFAKYRDRPSFFMLAPCLDPQDRSYHYSLFLQLGKTAAADNRMLAGLNNDIELRLRMNFHYDYCRKLSQLQPLRIFLISPESNAMSDYLQHRNQQGQRLGSIKPAVVDRGMNWHEIFSGIFITNVTLQERGQK